MKAQQCPMTEQLFQQVRKTASPLKLCYNGL